MAKYIHKSKYFYGQKISGYGLEHGYIDYATLAKSFDAVLNNDIMEKTAALGWWEQVNGIIDNSDEIEELIEEQEKIDDVLRDMLQRPRKPEIFQYYIISDNGANILCELTNEIVFYNEELDTYVWGVTHYGTAWDYVLTDIPVIIED